jgi:hypothetical protein
MVRQVGASISPIGVTIVAARIRTEFRQNRYEYSGYSSALRPCDVSFLAILKAMPKSMQPRRLFVIAGFITISSTVVLLAIWLGGATNKNAPASPTLNAGVLDNQAAPSLNNYERARIQSEAMRLAVNGKKEDSDMRDYYRSAFRLLRRLNDVHSRF